MVRFRNAFGDAERSLFAAETMPGEWDDGGDVDDTGDVDNDSSWTALRGVPLCFAYELASILLPIALLISLLRCLDNVDDDDDDDDVDGIAEFLRFFESFAMAGPSLK